jgi:xanthine dehydrogenase iron-sulfur cluster and FAD-binding subunit A
VEFYVDGKRCQVNMSTNMSTNTEANSGRFGAESTLLEYMRDGPPQQKSVKLVCGEGACGACSVQSAQWDVHAGKVRQCAVNACTLPLASADGMAITSASGLRTAKTTSSSSVRGGLCSNSPLLTYLS